MAIIYNAVEMDNPDYTIFGAWWVAQTEAVQLAFADRLAERARLLRKAILNRTVVVQAGDDYTDAGGSISGATPPELVGQWNIYEVTTAATNCFKAANNDI